MGTVTFTITRSGGLPAETVYFTTTQTEGYVNSGDYNGILNQAVTFTSGQATRTVTVTILDDTTVEPTETFGVKALAAHLSKRFKVPWEFLDFPTGL